MMRETKASELPGDADFFDWEAGEDNRFFISPELAIVGGWALRVPAPRGLPQQTLPLLSPPRSAS